MLSDNYKVVRAQYLPIIKYYEVLNLTPKRVILVISRQQKYIFCLMQLEK